MPPQWKPLISQIPEILFRFSLPKNLARKVSQDPALRAKARRQEPALFRGRPHRAQEQTYQGKRWKQRGKHHRGAAEPESECPPNFPRVEKKPRLWAHQKRHVPHFSAAVQLVHHGLAGNVPPSRSCPITAAIAIQLPRIEACHLCPDLSYCQHYLGSGLSMLGRPVDYREGYWHSEGPRRRISHLAILRGHPSKGLHQRIHYRHHGRKRYDTVDLETARKVQNRRHPHFLSRFFLRPPGQHFALLEHLGLFRKEPKSRKRNHAKSFIPSQRKHCNLGFDARPHQLELLVQRKIHSDHWAVPIRRQNQRLRGILLPAEHFR